MSQKVFKWLLQGATANGPGPNQAQVFDGRLNVKAWGLKAAGADLVTNGAMAADANWTKGTGWTIAAGVAASSGAQTADSDLSQAIAFVDGSIYEITYTVSGYSAGKVVAVVGDTEGTDRSANGTYSEFITAGAGADLDIRADLDFIGNIDDVTAKLVSSSWNGATVHIQIETDTKGLWVDIYTFTADGVQFGRVGSENENFQAVVTGAGGSTDVNCTITQ